MIEIFEYLHANGLAKQGQVARRLSKFTEKRPNKFLEGYFELASKRPVARLAKVGATDIYPVEGAGSGRLR